MFYAGSSLVQVVSTAEYIFFSDPVYFETEVVANNILWRIASFKDCSFRIS